MTTRQKTRRLFFALWPPEPVRLSIQTLLSALTGPLTGRLVPAHNFHITLHFIGQTSPQTMACLHAAAQSVRFDSFEMQLDCFGAFPRSNISWLGMQQKPDALLRLHKTLGDALAACDYSVERRPYSPHLTLARKSMPPPEPLPVFSIAWPVSEFVLLESVSESSGGQSTVRYKVIEKYPSG